MDQCRFQPSFVVFLWCSKARVGVVLGACKYADALVKGARLVFWFVPVFAAETRDRKH